MNKENLKKMKKMLAMVSIASCGMVGSLSSYAEVMDEKKFDHKFMDSFKDAVEDSIEEELKEKNVIIESETEIEETITLESETIAEETTEDETLEKETKETSVQETTETESLESQIESTSESLEGKIESEESTVNQDADLKTVAHALTERILVQDFEISDEEILAYDLMHYQMSMEDFLAFSKEVMSEAMKNNNPYEDIYGVAKTMYDLSLIPNDKKIATILVNQGMSYEQLLESMAILNHESKGSGTSYCDTYFVTNTACSRSNSYTWIGKGSNIHSQLTAKGQFESYYKGYYRALYGNTSLIGCQAVIDRLFVEVTNKYELYTTPFLGFRSKESKYGIQLVSGGNKFRNPQPENDRIKSRDSISYSATATALTKKLPLK